MSAVDGEEVFKPYQFKMQEIEGLRYRSMVSSELTWISLWFVGLMYENVT